MFAKFLVLLVFAALAVGIVARTSHGAGPERTYVVRPADTLWAIAARTYGGDPREGVWELEQRNHLRSATLRPGEKLVLPLERLSERRDPFVVGEVGCVHFDWEDGRRWPSRWCQRSCGS